ncbi:MAG: sigma-54-dependent Fis family transcriptional regulator, partial [bacterium]
EVSALNHLKIKRRVNDVEMVGQSAAIQKVKFLIERVATKDVTVLITGDSGTGKELVARAIHQKSSRNNKPLVAMNCAALPENLVESELFGHEKGAFTGAHCQKKGKFEFADGGTLFLDEIGDMSLATQSKLLRVLQEGTFQRIGGNKTLTVDVRVIAASNKDLTEEICQGKFREDLYYRVNVVQINIPPLRERTEDIPLLAAYFLKKYTDFYGKNINGIADKALGRLMQYDFPGNIRELQNLIERAVIMEPGNELTLDFIPISPLTAKIPQSQDSTGTLEQLEKEHIKRVIQQVNYNKSQAARILGIARKTLREKMQKYDLSLTQKVP